MTKRNNDPEMITESDLAPEEDNPHNFYDVDNPHNINDEEEI